MGLRVQLVAAMTAVADLSSCFGEQGPLNLSVTDRYPSLGASGNSTSISANIGSPSVREKVTDELLIARTCEGNREATAELFHRVPNCP